MHEDILEQIRSLSAKTKDGVIPWRTVGNNAYRWIRQMGTKQMLTTVQMTPQVKPSPTGNIVENHYVLTIQSNNPNEVILQLNSFNEEFALDALKALFDQVQGVVYTISANEIKNLLSGLN